MPCTALTVTLQGATGEGGPDWRPTAPLLTVVNSGIGLNPVLGDCSRKWANRRRQPLQISTQRHVLCSLVIGNISLIEVWEVSGRVLKSDPYTETRPEKNNVFFCLGIAQLPLPPRPPIQAT